MELGLLEGAPYFNCEVGLCTGSRSTVKGAKMVDNVGVHSISHVLLEFLSLRRVSLLGSEVLEHVCVCLCVYEELSPVYTPKSLYKQTPTNSPFPRSPLKRAPICT